MPSRTRPHFRSSSIPRSTSRFRPVAEALEDRVALNAPGTGWTLNWFDEFNGNALDTGKWAEYKAWGTLRDNGNSYLVHRNETIGGANLTGNLGVSGGQLHIKSQKTPRFTVGGKTYEYTTAYLTTGRGAIYRSWSSGYFEIRARLPQGAGNWPAFWMTNGWPSESDIMEWFPGQPRFHQGLYGMDRAWHDRNWWSNSDVPSRNWHTFGMEWGPGYQKYFIDDQLTYQTSGGLNGGQLGRYSNANDNALDVDYVRVYSYTPNASPRIANPGFEAGGASWSLSGSAQVVNYNERTGNRAVRMNGGAGAAQQVLTGLAPNTTYTLGGSTRVSHGAAEVRLGVRNHGGPEVWSSTRNTSYTRQTVHFMTGPGSTQATMRGFHKFRGLM